MTTLWGNEGCLLWLGVICWCVIKTKHKAKLWVMIRSYNRPITSGLMWHNIGCVVIYSEGWKVDTRAHPHYTIQHLWIKLWQHSCLPAGYRPNKESTIFLKKEMHTDTHQELPRSSNKSIFVNIMNKYFLQKHKAHSCHACGIIP